MSKFILPQSVTDQFNVLQYKAKSDSHSTAAPTITSGTGALTFASPSLDTTADIGKMIVIPGAGAGGIDLAATITAISSTTACTISPNASTSVNAGAVCVVATDCTQAFIDAMAAANSAGNVYTGSYVGIFWQPEVFVPSGVYYFLSGLGTIGAINIRGHDAILVMGNPATDFITLPYSHLIHGIKFVGGNTAITFSSNHVSETSFIDYCFFDHQISYGIGSDATADNVGTTISRCQFYDNFTSGPGLSGYQIYMRSSDDCFVTDCTMVSARTYFIRAAGTPLTISNLNAAPNNPAGAWILSDSADVMVYRSRFGGEYGGKCVVEWHNGGQMGDLGGSSYIPARLVIQDCEIYSDGPPVIKFFAVPGLFRFNGNAGTFSGATWDSSVPEEQRKAFGAMSVFDSGNNIQPFFFDASLSDKQTSTMAAQSSNDYRPIGNWLHVSDRAAYIPMTYPSSNLFFQNFSYTNLLSPNGTDDFGESTYNTTGVAPGNTNLQMEFSHGLDGLNTGAYTLVASVRVTNSVNLLLLAGGQQRSWDLIEGRHVLQMPFWILHNSNSLPAWQANHTYSIGDTVVIVDSSPGQYGHFVWKVKSVVSDAHSGSSSAGFINQHGPNTVVDNHVTWIQIEDYSVGMQFNYAGATGGVEISGFRIFSGNVNVATPNVEVFGSAIPITGYWSKGDIIKNALPVAGGPTGWVCTISGAMYSSSWAQNTIYNYGDCILNSGNIYQCMKSGTSLNSGSGPTTQLLNISDNSIFWNFIGTPGTFKAMANLAA